jgi:hypothetical protein
VAAAATIKSCRRVVMLLMLLTFCRQRRGVQGCWTNLQLWMLAKSFVKVYTCNLCSFNVLLLPL